jgi:hypothetical protein
VLLGVADVRLRMLLDKLGSVGTEALARWVRV